MGCVSSKLVKKEVRKEGEIENGNNHVVSLTSSTYGLLKLDKSPNQKQDKEPVKGQIEEITKKRSPSQGSFEKKRSPSRGSFEKKRSPSRGSFEKKGSPPRKSSEKKRSSPGDSFEVINTWELMKGLDEEEEVVPVANVDKKSPKSRPFLQTPLKFFNQMASPKRGKKSGGKENMGLYNRYSFSPKSRSINSAPNMSKRSQSDEKSDLLRGNLSKRKSLSPLFGVLLTDKDLQKEEVMAHAAKRTLNLKNNSSILDSFEKKCPSGGENSVIIYTTTLRGIRKTYEDCNNVRLTIESHGVQIFERDVSMDSSFKEDLRGLIGTKEVKVPVVFVKGRLIGGAEEVIKLEEEGKLGILLEGIPSAGATCSRCGGVRFVMCLSCNGSCKVLGEDKKKKVKCVKCNENGLIQCPLCC